MSCDTIQERFADYLTGEMEAGARRELQDHITACAACRTELEDLTAVWAKLGVLPEERPSGDLRRRFYSMLEEYKRDLEAPGRPVPHPFPGWKDWLTFRRPAFASAFSAFLLLIGLGAGWLLKTGPADSGDIASLHREIQDMRQQVALTLLSQPSAGERLQGVGYSTAIEKPSDKTLSVLIETLDTDPNPNVRLAAVDALYLFRNRPAVRESLVRSLAVQSSPLVQVALIDFLVDVREERAAGAFKALVEGDRINPEVRKRAEQGLKQII